MTEAELLLWLASQGVENFGAPIGTSAAGNLGLQQDIYSLIGNPIFQLQQGLMTPEEFQQNMQLTASTRVEPEEIDYFSLEQTTDDEDLITGYEMIKKGYTPDQVMRSLLSVLESVDFASTDSEWVSLQKEQIKLLSDDLNNFYDRWTANNRVQDGLETGEYFRGVDGSVRKQMDYEDAQKAYAAAGLPKGLQNPNLWRVEPDANLLAEAAKGDQRAEELAKERNRLRITLAPKARKEATQKASSAYEEFLSRTPEGRMFLEQERAKAAGEPQETRPRSAVIRRGGGEPVTLQTRAETLADENGRVRLRSRADILADERGRVTIDQGRNRSAVVRRGSPPDTTEAEKAAQRKAQEQAYWAKMQETYTGKSTLAEKLQPIKDVEDAMVAAQKAAYEKRLQASQQGTIRGMDLIQQAGPIAAMLSQPAAKPKYVKPKPRVLSDQEIEQMSNMIAGGLI